MVEILLECSEFLGRQRRRGGGRRQRLKCRHGEIDDGTHAAVLRGEFRLGLQSRQRFGHALRDLGWRACFYQLLELLKGRTQIEGKGLHFRDVVLLDQIEAFADQ